MAVTIDGTTGVSLVQDDTITDAKLALDANASEIKDALNATGSAPIYACRAWVNFNGTGTVAIRGSGNVSSITDNNTGDYTVNFTTAMPDVNYSAVASTGRDSGGGANLGASFNYAGTAPTTSAIRMNTRVRNTGSNSNSDHVFVAVFR